MGAGFIGQSTNYCVCDETNQHESGGGSNTGAFILLLTDATAEAETATEKMIPLTSGSNSKRKQD